MRTRTKILAIVSYLYDHSMVHSKFENECVCGPAHGAKTRIAFNNKFYLKMHSRQGIKAKMLTVLRRYRAVSSHELKMPIESLMRPQVD